jgi:hypothetical protein
MYSPLQSTKTAVVFLKYKFKQVRPLDNFLDKLKMDLDKIQKILSVLSHIITIKLLIIHLK